MLAALRRNLKDDYRLKIDADAKEGYLQHQLVHGALGCFLIRKASKAMKGPSSRMAQIKLTKIIDEYLLAISSAFDLSIGKVNSSRFALSIACTTSRNERKLPPMGAFLPFAVCSRAS